MKIVASKVYARALQKAAELLGGRRKLAERLGIPAADLERWIADGKEPPREIFLRAVDLIIDETEADGGEEPADPPEPRSSAAPSPRDFD